MGREVRRIPLDFDLAIGETWPGFLSPEFPACPDCNRMGMTSAHEWLETIVHLIMVLGEDGRKTQRKLDGQPVNGYHPHPWLMELACRPDKVPSPDAALLSNGLAGRTPSFLGHDSCDKWEATRKIIAAAGLDPEVWGVCPTCGGHGYASEEVHKAMKAWEPTDPPNGDGWQIWETVSEGSPITPVFATPEELAGWCVAHEPWHMRMTSDQWLKFIDAGWAPSVIMTPRTGGVMNGAEAIGKGLMDPEPEPGS